MPKQNFKNIRVFSHLGTHLLTPVIEHWKKAGHNVEVYPEFAHHLCFGADFVFVDFADEMARRAAEIRLPMPLVVRLHAYEIFVNTPAAINWQNVDTLIYVSDYIEEQANSLYVPACRTVVIPNGVDLDRWTFERRSPKASPQVAVIGEIGLTKGTQLLAEVAYRWPSATFHLAGIEGEGRFVTNLANIAAKMGIQDRIFYYGWVEPSGMNAFLEEKDYLLICSPFEAHNVSIMEAMAKGIKPLIYNFPNAEKLYPVGLLWKTVDELLWILEMPYESEHYRQYLIDSGWTTKDMCRAFDKVLAEPKALAVKDVIRYYNGVAGILETESDKMIDLRHEAAKSLIQKHVKPEDKVLDMGCGVGVTTFAISKITKDVVGMDISPKMVELAQKKYPSVQFVAGDCTRTLLDRGFNVACLFDFLEHVHPDTLPGIWKNLEQFDRILLTLPKNDDSPRLRQIVDSDIQIGDINPYLPDFRVTASQEYDLKQWGRHNFYILEKMTEEVAA